LDLVFLAYLVVFFSFVRQAIIYRICYPIAQYLGIRKKAKLARFGEQGYAIIYFAFFGAWGLRIMSQLPTWWFDCQRFWIGASSIVPWPLLNLRHPALDC
jgi:acyl-CoA-dependent ceramide synthase